MSHMLFSSTQTKEIVRRYLAGEPAEVIARSSPFGIHTNATTIKNYLKREGIKIRTQDVPVDVQKRIITLLREGKTNLAVAAECGVGSKFVSKLATENLAPRRVGRKRTCFVDDYAFDTLTPEALYFLGFLWADGCLDWDCAGDPKLILVVAEKDREHLEKFKKFLKSTYTISSIQPSKTAWGGPSVRHEVRSTQICNTLYSYGFDVKRERVAIDEITKSRDFFRGCVDGDGWLGFDKYPYVALSGHKLLLEKFQQFLRKNNLANLNIVPTESGIWKILTSGSTALEIIKTLYADNTIALDRKNLRAQDIIAGKTDKSERYEEGPSTRKFSLEQLSEIVDDDL